MTCYLYIFLVGLKSTIGCICFPTHVLPEAFFYQILITAVIVVRMHICCTDLELLVSACLPRPAPSSLEGQRQAGRRRRMPVIASVQQASRTSPLVLPWRLNDQPQKKKTKKHVALAAAGQQIVAALRHRCLARRSERREHCESAIGGREEDDNNGFAGTKRVCAGRRKEMVIKRCCQYLTGHRQRSNNVE